MRYLPLVLLVLLGCTHQPSDRSVAFSAKHATEATLTFAHAVELESATKPTMAEAREQIEEQVMHLFGPMERADTMAAPKEDHTIANVQIQRKDDETFLISYDYEGTIVIEKGPRTKYDVTLPNNPDTIFQAAMVGNHNPCTDDHYQTDGDFWYFWSPAPVYPKCKLKEGQDYQVVHGRIERDANSKTTYPEYDRLANKDEIRIDVFFGMDDPGHSHDPARSKDDGALSFRTLKQRLESAGFSFAAWSDADSREIVKGTRATLPYVEEGTKEAGDITLRVRLFFGETGIDENSRAFHYFFKDALAKASVVLYDGHSGLGGHLDLDDIADTEGFRFTMPKNRYQILFFNSCDSYTYYNTKFFQKKRKGRGQGVDPKASKNLDVLANGLGTEFDVEQNENFALINAVATWASSGKWTSYQKLAAEIDDDNLFTVNGDEDNPKKPRQLGAPLTGRPGNPASLLLQPKP